MKNPFNMSHAGFHKEVRWIMAAAASVLTLALWGLAGWSADLTRLDWIGGVSLILLFQVVMYRRIQRKQQTVLETLRSTASDQGALLSVFSAIKPDLPLPPFTGWTVTPEIGRFLVLTVFEQKPLMIMECGSGLSTILMAYSLKRVGRGSLIALEHDRECASRTDRFLRVHGLDEWARVEYTPLAPIRLNGREWLWYDIASVRIPRKVDLLFVDGPPRRVHEESRYPAMHVLFPHFSSEVHVILDDAHRDGERTVLEKWMREFDGFRRVGQDAHGRAVVLTRHSDAG